jgi:hypothetical protein
MFHVCVQEKNQKLVQILQLSPIRVIEEVTVMEYRLSSPFPQNVLSASQHIDRYDLVEYIPASYSGGPRFRP